jgi:hypothetical protein
MAHQTRAPTALEPTSTSLDGRTPLRRISASLEGSTPLEWISASLERPAPPANLRLTRGFPSTHGPSSTPPDMGINCPVMPQVLWSKSESSPHRSPHATRESDPGTVHPGRRCAAIPGTIQALHARYAERSASLQSTVPPAPVLPLRLAPRKGMETPCSGTRSVLPTRQRRLKWNLKFTAILAILFESKT